MPRYSVKYSPRARQDLQESYEWGVEAWGREEAANWVRNIEKLIEKQLSLVPMACPLAPEDAEFDLELRHLPIRRYRILCTISDDTVFVLRIRGPFSGGTMDLA